MKEYPEPDYFLRITSGEYAIDPRLVELLPRTYSIDVNHIVQVVIVPRLAEHPWPPAFFPRWDAFATADEAALYVLQTSEVTIAPSARERVRCDSVRFAELPETPHSVFWYPRDRHEHLVRDVEQWSERPYTGELLRLSDLGSCPLADFLRNQLPHAALNDYQRRILCLPPA